MTFLPLEPEHDGGPGLVLGSAEDDEGERGGDPLCQQVPSPSPAAWEAGQVSLQVMRRLFPPWEGGC